jgi:hypothetical protein
MVRIPLWGAREAFQKSEADLSFKTKTNPALDNYLCVMESRGWSIVAVTQGVDGMSVLITFHRPEPVPEPEV